MKSTSLYKSLKNIVTSFKFKDIYAENRAQSEYTYYKNKYASRLGRIHLSKLFDSIHEVKTLSASFSDHLCVTVQLSAQIKIARPRWKMNTSLLTNALIKLNSQARWSHLQSQTDFTILLAYGGKS